MKSRDIYLHINYPIMFIVKRDTNLLRSAKKY